MQIETPTAGKMASLPLRPVIRVFQPHEGHFNRFWGSGAQPQFKKTFMAYLRRLCDAQLMRSGNGALLTTFGVSKNSTRIYTFYTAKTKT